MKHSLFLLKKLSLGKALLLIIFTASALMLSACQNNDGPEQAVTDYFTALGQNKVTLAMQLIYIPKEHHGDIKFRGELTLVPSQIAEEIKQHGGLKDFKIGDIVYSADKKRAVVHIAAENNDGTKAPDRVNVIHDGNQWFIDLTSPDIK